MVIHSFVRSFEPYVKFVQFNSRWTESFIQFIQSGRIIHAQWLIHAMRLSAHFTVKILNVYIYFVFRKSDILETPLCSDAYTKWRKRMMSYRGCARFMGLSNRSVWAQRSNRRKLTLLDRRFTRFDFVPRYDVIPAVNPEGKCKSFLKSTGSLILIPFAFQN